MEDLREIPELYGTDKTPDLEKVIYMHFFIGGSDWYAAEYSQGDRLFFGYAILNGDLQNSEWGYFSLDEMQRIHFRGIEIDRDLHWDVRKAREVDKIAEANGLR